MEITPEQKSYTRLKHSTLFNILDDYFKNPKVDDLSNCPMEMEIRKQKFNIMYTWFLEFMFNNDANIPNHMDIDSHLFEEVYCQWWHKDDADHIVCLYYYNDEQTNHYPKSALSLFRGDVKLHQTNFGYSNIIIPDSYSFKKVMTNTPDVLDLIY